MLIAIVEDAARVSLAARDIICNDCEGVKTGKNCRKKETRRHHDDPWRRWRSGKPPSSSSSSHNTILIITPPRFQQEADTRKDGTLLQHMSHCRDPS